MSRIKYEICVWKIAHLGIKYFPLTIITFTVMLVPLCLNLYYFLNMFYCTNVTKVNRTRIGSWAWRSTCVLLWLLLWLGLIVLWLYITLNSVEGNTTWLSKQSIISGLDFCKTRRISVFPHFSSLCELLVLCYGNIFECRRQFTPSGWEVAGLISNRNSLVRSTWHTEIICIWNFFVPRTMNL